MNLMALTQQNLRFGAIPVINIEKKGEK